MGSDCRIITVRIGERDTKVQLLLGHDRVLEHDVNPPYIAVEAEGVRPLVVCRDPLLEFPYEHLNEILVFATPRRAELLLPELLPRAREPGFKQVWELIDIDPASGDLVLIKEATGETYEQRSHTCFEDVCKIAVGIWRNPLASSKELNLKSLRGSGKKRRVYEDREWMNAIIWGEGDGYWSQNPSSSQPDSKRINGEKMRELEDQLRGASLGVLPEVVARIDIGPGLAFLDGEFRDSVERDCKEINEGAKVGAAKSVIVLCGSVVEALLYDLLKESPEKAKQAAKDLAPLTADDQARKALEREAKKPLDHWSAWVTIKVAHKLVPNIVSADAAAYADVLRDYRNLIHPGKAERSARSVDQYTAGIAIQVVNLVIAGRRPSGGGT